VTGIQNFIDGRAEASYLEVGSQELAQNTSKLQTQPASLGDPLTLFVGVYNFLFVPIPFVDNGSFFLNLQSYESFFWYLFYLILFFLLFGLMRGRYVLNLVTASSSLFTMVFIGVSALTETNDGTSVRHRAVLLIGILVMLATFRSKLPDRRQVQNSNF
jgi:peptidoglycan/LPS O-acetylase OafA/YrhL